jgi:IclR family KDG regulon transcriptional repressor
MLEDDRYVIEILDVALNIIDSMAFNQEEYHSPSVLARQFNINRSRTFRILKTLERRGFVDYDPGTESYRLGMKFLSISKNLRDRLSLRREAEEILKDLAAETGDTSYLIISSGTMAIVVDRFSGDNMLQLSAPIGALLPFHVGAAAKVLLAFMPDEQRERLLNGMDFSYYTPNTITDKNLFIKTLDEIRRLGYAVDEQDFELGAYAFGAPVFDHDGKVVAGLSITTPTARYSLERREEIIRLVVAAAKNISEKIGYQSNLEKRN